MKFSFIIPTKNEGKYLEKCLVSIKAQIVEDYEVIIVDTNSTDNTKTVAKKYGARIVDEPRRGASVARNAGARVSRGNILIFADADARFDKNFLQLIENRFNNDISGGVFRLSIYDAKNAYI